MNQQTIIILIALAVIATIVILVNSNKKEVWKDVGIPTPAVLRTDLNYVYYLYTPGQMQHVADHTNLVWHGQFCSPEILAKELQNYPHRLILDCQSQLFKLNSKGKSEYSTNAALDLHAYFAELNGAGLLDRVAYLVAMDEPNFFCASELDLQKAIDILKLEAKNWKELDGVKYMCIYGSNEDYWVLKEFDIIGTDNYAQKSEVLTKGSHAVLMRQRLPHQQMLILPGAAYGQDPTDFVNYGHAVSEVWGIVPFVYAHVPESADKEGWVGLEKQTPAAREIYRQAGYKTLHR